MLATLTRAPSVFSPRRDLLRAQQRATLVLDSMVDNGAITEVQAAEARAREYQGAPDAKGRFVFGVNRSDNGRWTVVRRPDVGTVRRD